MLSVAAEAWAELDEPKRMKFNRLAIIVKNTQKRLGKRVLGPKPSKLKMKAKAWVRKFQWKRSQADTDKEVRLSILSAEADALQQPLKETLQAVRSGLKHDSRMSAELDRSHDALLNKFIKEQGQQQLIDVLLPLKRFKA